MISFTLPITPFSTTHHAKKIVRVGKFSRLADKPELVTARQTYEALMLPYRPEKPMIGPVVLRIRLVWPFLKSARKRDILKGDIPKSTKPDCTNLGKTLEDCLARCGFLQNDAQVSSLDIKKRYQHTGYIAITLEADE